MAQLPKSKLEGMARLGYSARGAIYLLVGGLAVLAAIGEGGRTTGSRGALISLMDEPLGDVLLAVIALGLIGYSVWRFIQAATDTDNHGTDAKGLIVRSGLFVSSVVHLGLAFFTATLIFGIGTGSGTGNSKQDWISWIFAQPYGRWAVGVVGLIVVGVGISYIVKGMRDKFKKYLVMDEKKMRWVSPICRFGLAARGVAFIIIGGFIIAAAWKFDPEKARGLNGALDAIRGQPYGPWLLGILALGLFAFGIYCIIEAIYRRIKNPVPT